jgi:hypothetical protein
MGDHNATGRWPSLNGSIDGHPRAGGMPPFNNSMFDGRGNTTGGGGEGWEGPTWPFVPFNMSSSETTVWGIANHLVSTAHNRLVS